MAQRSPQREAGACLMSALDVFQYAGRQLRTAGASDSPRFVTADVLAILDLDRTAMRRWWRYRRREGCGTQSTPLAERRTWRPSREWATDTHSILGSRKAEAREFKCWVTHSMCFPRSAGHGPLWLGCGARAPSYRRRRCCSSQLRRRTRRASGD